MSTANRTKGKPKAKGGGAKAKAPALTREIAPVTLRFADVLKAIGFKERWLRAAVRSGKFPPPDKYEGRTPLWYPATVARWAGSEGA